MVPFVSFLTLLMVVFPRKKFYFFMDKRISLSSCGRGFGIILSPSDFIFLNPHGVFLYF